MTAASILRELQLAFVLLTRLPVGKLPDPPPPLARAVWAFPLTGLVTGAILWLVFTYALAFGSPPLVAAFLALGAVILLTGGLHHDGLADLADGLGGGRDKDHALEIMRDSRIGSYGVLALVFAVTLSGAALAEIGTSLSLADALLIGVSSRLYMVVAMWRLSPARDNGLGKQVSAVPAHACLPGATLAIILLVWTGGFKLLVLGLMALIAVFLARLARQKIGGQTGDVLGAIQSSSESAGLIGLAMLGALQ